MPRKLTLEDVFPSDMDPVPVQAVLKMNVRGDINKISKGRCKTFKNHLKKARIRGHCMLPLLLMRISVRKSRICAVASAR